MDIETYISNKKIIGSIIKFNRMKQNISQKSLSKGVCVASYLSRIENGDLIPSEEVLSIIFSRLGLTFNDSEEFIKRGSEYFDSFFDKLNFNEFDYTNKIFSKIEAHESEYITSPLIIEYYLAKIARYCSTPNRDSFESSKHMILSSFDLLSAKQKFLYNFYVGVDTLILSQDKLAGKKLIEEALTFKETGHCYFWLSYAYRIENNPIKAYDCIKKALDLYVSEGNIISIMSCYEKLAEVYFMLDNYQDAIHYLKISLNIAKKINNIYFIEHLNSILAWTYYRIKDYNTALEFTNNNSGLIDHRMIIPDSIIACLTYFELNDKTNLKLSMLKLKDGQSLEHIGPTLSSSLYKFFELYISNDAYMKDNTLEAILIEVIDNMHKLVELKKVFISILKEYFICNRRYKDALLL